MQRWKKLAPPLAAAVLALLVVRIGFRAAIDSVTKPTAAEGERPVLAIESLKQAVLVAPAQTSVRAVFPVSNAGQRRLVVRQLRRPCCDPVGPAPLVLEPGQSGQLVVEAPAAELLQAGLFRQGFGTNDPRRPEFWLTVRLANEPTPARHSAASTPARLPDRSVLVKRPASASAPASGPASQ